MTRLERIERRRKAHVIIRDGARCQFCGDQSRVLHVQTTVYTRVVGDDIHHEQHDITLCDPCRLDEERLKVNDAFLTGLFYQTGLSRRQLYALAVSLRRHFADKIPREGEFQKLTQYLERT